MLCDKTASCLLIGTMSLCNVVESMRALMSQSRWATGMGEPATPKTAQSARGKNWDPVQAIGSTGEAGSRRRTRQQVPSR